ncbi:polyprenyl synthetase family protein, partial [Microbacterium sp. HMWF026]|uniref:polyprenyl synthetase family protein n=1 Tax=Microbacterium sp. HMWF026 TaxID=2056861 RepID=UPI002159F92C
VLGVFGDTAVTGKPVGDDLREGKRTVLVAYAREALPESERLRVDALLGDPGLDADQITDLQRVIVDTGALERLERLISGYAHTADGALEGAPLR